MENKNCRKRERRKTKNVEREKDGRKCKKKKRQKIKNLEKEKMQK